MQWWIWCVAGLALLIGELVTPGGFYLLFMGVSGILVGVLASTGLLVDHATQWIIFAVLSLVLLFGFRRKLLSKMGNSLVSDQVDSMIGELGVAREKFGAEGFGKVEVRGSVWSAKNVSSREVKEGERIKIVALNELTLHVEPIH